MSFKFSTTETFYASAMTGNNSGQSLPVHAELASAQPHFGQASTRPSPGPPRDGRKSTRCRFFGTKRGCRAGDACPYVHDITPGRQLGESASQSTIVLDNQSYDSKNDNSGVVQKPVPSSQIDNPREFEINQIRRRFHPEEKSDEDGTLLKFKMTPTDPDFSFVPKALECLLHVPEAYKLERKPSLEILNQGLDSKYKGLVQRKFDEITHQPGTLLRWMNLLDRYLPDILASNVAETPPPTNDVGNVHVRLKNPTSTSLSSSMPPGNRTIAQEKESAQRRRQREISQLTSRLGRSSLFSKSADNASFDVPLQPLKPLLIPDSLRSIKVVKLVVPELYPLEPCQIRLTGISDKAARNAEAAFDRHVIASAGLSLVAHINYLAATIHTLATQPFDDDASHLSNSVASMSLETPEATRSSAQDHAPASPPDAADVSTELPDRPHVHVIPRPPEWAFGEDSEVEESDISDDSDAENDFTDEEDAGGVRVPETPAPPVGRGVSLSFPSLDLYGIELLELKSLSLTLKCERCKELLDMKNIKIGDDGATIPQRRVDSCKKCGNYFSVGFRREFMHPNSTRAGQFDLEGCLVVEMLPSNFLPTCSNCSTVFPTPGVVAVRGDNATAVCRGCHRQMRFKIPEVKFLLVSAGSEKSHTPARSKKPKESLGIVAGQELPRRGRCVHYGKSYRWFRFSCCAKVFSCDKCHDAATDHPNEHANRMICGFCSREQNYRPEDCGLCHATLIGKAGSGFWEGGKGTRDRARMSRKDPRKYKRRGGNTPATSSHKR